MSDSVKISNRWNMVWKKLIIVTICTNRIEEYRQEFPHHTRPLSYNFIEMHWKRTFRKHITEQIQWCRDQIIEKAVIFYCQIGGVLTFMFLIFRILRDSYNHLQVKLNVRRIIILLTVYEETLTIKGCFKQFQYFRLAGFALCFCFCFT